MFRNSRGLDHNNLYICMYMLISSNLGPIIATGKGWCVPELKTPSNCFTEDSGCLLTEATGVFIFLQCPSQISGSVSCLPLPLRRCMASMDHP